MTKMTPQMLRSEIDSIFLELFELEKEELKAEAKLFEELGLDSLDAVDLVVMFQKKFKIKPENSELQTIRTLQDVYILVEKYYDQLSEDN